ncbi:MAG: hypothetical protein SGJ09_14960 [Phycisphaerae bacterium]|nr:hypothetical protein [Phycisphaerae bacterium]
MAWEQINCTHLLIAGMKNDGCREAIVRAVFAVHGVLEADVNLFRANAIVRHQSCCGAVDLVNAIGRAGYAGVAVPLVESRDGDESQRQSRDLLG